MRLEGRNLYVTVTELDRISGLKDDGEALAKYLGPHTCAAIQHDVGLAPDPVLDTIAPWRRWLCGLTIVVESVQVARINHRDEISAANLTGPDLLAA